MSSFCKCKNFSHFFSKNISVYAKFNDQSLHTLTNDIVTFEQLGPGIWILPIPGAKREGLHQTACMYYKIWASSTHACEDSLITVRLYQFRQIEHRKH